MMPASFAPGAINPEERLQFSVSELSCNLEGISESGGASVPIAFSCHLKDEQQCHPSTSLSHGEVPEQEPAPYCGLNTISHSDEEGFVKFILTLIVLICSSLTLQLLLKVQMS